MSPLGGGAAVTPAAAALTTRSAPRLVAAAAAAGVAGVTVAVNEPLNERFASTASMTGDEVAHGLARWRRWHHARIALGVVATLAAVRAARPSR
jgi:uncharacterized membrane protein